MPFGWLFCFQPAWKDAPSFFLPGHTHTSERSCAPLRPTVFDMQMDEQRADLSDAELQLSEQSGSPGEIERTALIFGSGRTYASTDLRARASMLETLEAHINLLSEELEMFPREINQRRIQRTPQERPLS